MLFLPGNRHYRRFPVQVLNCTEFLERASCLVQPRSRHPAQCFYMSLPILSSRFTSPCQEHQLHSTFYEILYISSEVVPSGLFRPHPLSQGIQDQTTGRNLPHNDRKQEASVLQMATNVHSTRIVLKSALSQSCRHLLSVHKFDKVGVSGEWLEIYARYMI